MSETGSFPFASEAEFRAAVAQTIRAATRELRIFDSDLGRMALDSPERAESLAAFLAGGSDRRLRIVLHNPEPLKRNCPRLLGVMRRFSHAVDVRQSPDHLRQLSDAYVLADAQYAAIRFHADHPRGKEVVGDKVEVHPWWQRFDDLWEASTPCTPITTLGI